MKLRASVRETTGSTRHLVHGRESENIASDVAWIEIKLGDGGFYLLYCTATGECLADTWHPSLDEAKRQASVELEIEEADWEGHAGAEVPITKPEPSRG